MTKYYQRNDLISGDIIDREMPTRSIEDNLIINKDLSMAMGWKVHFPNLYTMASCPATTNPVEDPCSPFVSFPAWMLRMVASLKA